MSQANDVYVNVALMFVEFSDSCADVADTFRAVAGRPPATKGLRYWQRREARAVRAASLRGRVERLRDRGESFLTEIGRRIVNIARSARGDWPDWSE